MYKFITLTAALSVFAEQALAQTPEQKEKYTRWSTEMDLVKYTWEPFEVTTDDGYILTLFHITGTQDDGPFTPTKEPVLLQHGHMMDAASWMNDYHANKPWLYSTCKPMPMQLADLGYDVWMGNNRGTEYSQGHTHLSTDDREYWEFSFAEMGLYDDPANISFIKQQTGYDKIFYLGYSQGTIQIFYGLSYLEESFHQHNLIKAVTLAPCFVASWYTKIELSDFQSMPDWGVYAINGPNWAQDVETICDNVNIVICEYFRTYSG